MDGTDASTAVVEEGRPYDPKQFGGMLRRRREARGWTQVELAKKLSISNTYLSQLEKGRLVEVTLTFLRRIGKVFGMTLQQVMNEGGVLQNGPTAAILSPHIEDVQILVSNTPDLTIAQLRQLNALARQMAEDNERERADEQSAETGTDTPAEHGAPADSGDVPPTH